MQNEETIQRIQALFADANLLKAQSRYEEAVSLYLEILKAQPNLAPVHNNLGNCYYALGNFDEAMHQIERALAIEPSFPEAHFNYGTQLLLRGEFKKGWEEFEWRWKTDAYLPFAKRYIQPRWHGESLPGKALLLFSEQGLGDSIQMIRFAGEVKGRVGRLIVSCQPELVRLFEGISAIDQVIPLSARVPAHDVQASLFSLPAILGWEPSARGGPSRYLSAPDLLVREWEGKLPQSTRSRVGICWAGNPKHAKNLLRNIRLPELLRCIKGLNSEVVSLQKNLTAEEKGILQDGGVLDFSDELRDFADTAALIENLDFVISVDTAIAHLAGALNLPGNVLLPFSPDWRWRLHSETSAWYPSLKLLRQKQAGHWDGVLRFSNFQNLPK